MRVLSIDPGQTSGWCYYRSDEGSIISGTWDLKVMSATKKRVAEPKHHRLVKLWKCLSEYVTTVDLVVVEGAQSFKRGLAAVESSHKFRGVIELFCGLHGIEIVMVQPADVKRFVTGDSVADKDRMSVSVFSRWGFKGSDDNECDSYAVMRWALEFLPQLKDCWLRRPLPNKNEE